MLHSRGSCCCSLAVTSCSWTVWARWTSSLEVKAQSMMKAKIIGSSWKLKLRIWRPGEACAALRNAGIRSHARSLFSVQEVLFWPTFILMTFSNWKYLLIFSYLSFVFQFWNGVELQTHLCGVGCRYCCSCLVLKNFEVCLEHAGGYHYYSISESCVEKTLQTVICSEVK